MSESNCFSGSFDPNGPPPEEVTNYLSGVPYADPETILVLHGVAPLIGGYKSTKFSADYSQPSQEIPPDSHVRVNLSKGYLDPTDLAPYAVAEMQAEDRYGAALLEVQQLLADARSRGVDVKTLLIPDTVDNSALELFRRLERLAQDTGLEVTIRRQHHDQAINLIETDFPVFRPPHQAESAEQYWTNRVAQNERSESLAAFSRDREASRWSLPNLTDDEVYGTLRLLPSADSLPPGPSLAGAEWYDNLRLIADRDPNTLREWLLQDNATARHALATIRELGTRLPQGAAYLTRGVCREILAKIGDNEGLRAINNELGTNFTRFEDSERTIHIPLSMYLQNDPAFLNTMCQRVRGMSTHEPNQQTFHLISALCHTGSPLVASLISDLLKVPLDATRAYTELVISPVIEHLPKYLETIRGMQDPKNRDQTLSTVEASLATFLDNVTAGRFNHADVKRTLKIWEPGNILLGFHNPSHRAILEQSIWLVYKMCGFIISDPEFQKQYLLFREQHGDIPEIQPACISRAEATGSPSEAGLNTDAATGDADNLKEIFAKLHESLRQLHVSLGELAIKLERLKASIETWRC